MGVFSRERAARTIVVCAAVCLIGPPFWAEAPRPRRIGVAQGLAHSRVERIVSDSRGLLWFCTADTASAYDGAEFLHFRTDWGGGEQEMFDLAEAPDGRLWAAAWRGGLAILDPAEPSTERQLTPLETEHPRNVRRLVFDDRGRLWIGTSSGLFRIEDPTAGVDSQVVPHELKRHGQAFRPSLWDLEIGADGRLWLATNGRGVFTVDPDDHAGDVSSVPCLDTGRAFALARGEDGAIWVGHESGVVRCDAGGERLESFGRDRLAGGGAVDVHRARDGALWIAGAVHSVFRLADGELESIELPESFHPPRRFAEDIEGNVWLGTMTGGAHVFGPSGIVAFAEPDGLGFNRQAKFTLAADGTPIVSSGEAIYLFRNGRFFARRPPELRGQDSGSLADNATVYVDRRRRSWIGSRNGLFVSEPESASFEHARRRLVKEFDAATDGRVTSIAESPLGEIWLGTTGGSVRIVGGNGTIRAPPEPPRLGSILRIVFDGSRTWVVGSAGVAAWNAEATGRTEFETFRDKRPFDLRLGPKGNVLVATRGHGVWTLRTDSSGGDAFERIEAIPARLTVRCLEFDDDDRMYLGTQSGLYRFDPRSERLRRFTPEDGLSGLEVYYAIRAQDGTLWFSFERGIARVDPDRLLDGAGTTPSLSIRDVRINGRSRPIPPLGTLAVTGIVAPPGPLSIEVDVSAVRFRDSSGLGFQYRLTDDDDAWSAPTETRTLSFVGLSAGRHRVEFRSILDGVGSSEHARLELKVLAPLWRRPWFVALFVGVVVVAAAAFLRWRWLQVARLQEIRLGLATDLHDEIGSGLSQVSILSELARRGIDGDPASTESSLRRIGEVSRNLVDSMAEIVWAINPQRDTPQDLVQRMRRFADDVLSSEHTRVTFETEGWSGAGPLGPRLRRDLFLMLKEAVHNVAKHAEAAHVRIRLSREGRRLRMLIEDDGRGFDPAVKTDGLGRPSIADRARRLGGRARIESTPGRGTRVEIEIPLGKGNTA